MTAEAPPLDSPLELNEPNATLYISNIDWKIKKAVLRRSLHALFGRHGKIIDIITLRKEGLRGQAWVIFDHVSAATAALQMEQGFTFFGKDLKVAYAREKSDRIAKMDGTFVPKDRRIKRERKVAELEAFKKAKLAIQEAIEAETTTGDDGAAGVTSVEDPSSLATTTTREHDEETPSSNETASNILFAESLPSECNEMMLGMLFRQYAGFKEVRVPRPGLAFVEFDDEPHATVALKSLNGFKLTASDTLSLKYGKS